MLGNSSRLGVPVSALGLGCMPMSIEGRPDRARAVSTIHQALEVGITLIDTADAYHRDANEVGHNEELIAAALRSWGGDISTVVVATKGGHLRPGDGRWTQNGDPSYLMRAAEDSARRLGVDAIGLYQFHRPDPEVPFAESIGALVELLDAGTIVRAGISNVSVAQIEEADRLLGGRLTSVQNRFSPGHTEARPELDHCDREGIAFLPYAPLGGISDAARLGTSNKAFQQVADARGVSPQQIALAWELSLSPVVVPIPGASRPASIADSARSVDLDLAAEEVRMLSV